MTNAQPWYREPWPWRLMAGPAAVVVAGTITTVIAVKGSDPLVADDYYKQGLMVNRVLARNHRAEALGIAATVQFNAARDRVRVVLASREALPERLKLTLVHPTRGTDDRFMVLEREAPGVYRGSLATPRAGTYDFNLEDARGEWRVSGRWSSAADAVSTGVAE